MLLVWSMSYFQHWHVNVFTLIQSKDIDIKSILGYWHWSNVRMWTDTEPMLERWVRWSWANVVL